MFLSGKGAAPDEWLLSLLCEHFGYTLREALHELYGVEWEQAPAGLHWAILEMRAYAQARAEVERSRADRNYKVEATSMVRKVYEIEADLAREREKQGHG